MAAVGPLPDRNLPRANRSGGSRRSRPPGHQIDNGAAHLPPGKRSRLRLLNPDPKIVKFGNQARHFLNT